MDIKIFSDDDFKCEFKVVRVLFSELLRFKVFHDQSRKVMCSTCIFQMVASDIYVCEIHMYGVSKK